MVCDREDGWEDGLVVIEVAAMDDIWDVALGGRGMVCDREEGWEEGLVVIEVAAMDVIWDVALGGRGPFVGARKDTVVLLGESARIVK